ncbi:MAG: hypothetical protein LBG95_01540 [Treponema sp.]|jgi:hypothetical protein|nr:hypothetical protein [Treponema sp.]
MANKRFWLGMLAMALAFGMTVVGCDDGSTNGNGDFIKVISVTPNAGLIDGTEQRFTVAVEYVLLTQDEAQINVGFNSGLYGLGVNWYAHAGEPKIIQKGSGTHTFNVTAFIKKWNTAKFGVCVFLDPYPFPEGDSLDKLASDFKELLVQ